MNQRAQAGAKRSERLVSQFAAQPLLQRKCSCGGAPGLAGECENCGSKKLQRRAADASHFEHIPAIVHAALRSPGEPLGSGTKYFFESRFGHEFSRVRIHANETAAESARAINALAFTVGTDVVFAAGRYAPDTTAGKRLLAHELTHVVQQSGAIHKPISRAVGDENDTEEPAVPEAESDVAVAVEEAAAPAPESVPAWPSTVTADMDHAPKEEQEQSISAQAEGGLAPPLSFVAADHPSEREAEAASAAIISGVALEPSFRLRERFPASRYIHRQIYWEDRSALTWEDFKAAPPEGAEFDAMTWSGMQFPAMTPKQDTDPSPAGAPKACTVSKKKTTEFAAKVYFDPSTINVRGLMKPDSSWVKPDKKQAGLLAHEQGHFDISNVIAEKTEAAAVAWSKSNFGAATKCGKTPALNAAILAWNKLKAADAITDIWKNGEALRKQAQNDYDDATNHGLNAANQKTWLTEIAANLPKYVLK